MGGPCVPVYASDWSESMVKTDPNDLSVDKSTEAETSEPKLPCELEQLIFELAAEANRSHVPVLMLVAHRTKEWLSKYLYSAIIRRSLAGDPTRHSYDPPAANLPSYARHVNSLLVYFVIETDTLMNHLSLCTNLTNVAIWCQSLPEDTLAALSALPALTELTVNISALIRGGDLEAYNFSDPLFKRLTHLDILDGCPSWSKLRGIQTMENLTHLGLTDVSEVVLLNEVMKACKQLTAVVLHESGLGKDEYQDVRIVQCQFKTAEYVDDWIRQVEGDKCFWDVAKEMIRERRNKTSTTQGSQIQAQLDS